MLLSSVVSVPLVYAPKVMIWLLMTTQLKISCADRYGPNILKGKIDMLG
uniref:Uncharacterized protein n=1 Tax=Rhizophora mucronata TaxID=61149 RepID=A0A2P2N8L8_RHIMU